MTEYQAFDMGYASYRDKSIEEIKPIRLYVNDPDWLQYCNRVSKNIEAFGLGKQMAGADQIVIDTIERLGLPRDKALIWENLKAPEGFDFDNSNWHFVSIYDDFYPGDEICLKYFMWCHENINHPWLAGPYSFCFYSEEDAVLFELTTETT